MKPKFPLLWVVAAVLFVLIGVFAVQFMLSAPARLQPEGRLFEVRRGETGAALSARLQSEGIIRSAFGFDFLARIEGKSGKARAGTYRLKPGQGTAAVLDLVTEGREALLRVTLPEGLTTRETASILEKAGVCSAADFMAAATDPVLLGELAIAGPEAEGFLFPDTYFLPRNFGAADTLRALVANFRLRIASIPEASNLSPSSLREKIILASIVEREYRVPEEAPLIASVFVNRLAIGMGLQSCATVVYVITERLGKPHPDVVYDRDLKIADPWNTYLNRGLPPGPIANPGMVALRSAFEPAKTAWLYFRLVDADKGLHHFSATFDEHLSAASFIVKRTAAP